MINPGVRWGGCGGFENSWACWWWEYWSSLEPQLWSLDRISFYFLCYFFVLLGWAWAFQCQARFLLLSPHEKPLDVERDPKSGRVGRNRDFLVVHLGTLGRKLCSEMLTKVSAIQVSWKSLAIVEIEAPLTVAGQMAQWLGPLATPPESEFSSWHPHSYSQPSITLVPADTVLSLWPLRAPGIRTVLGHTCRWNTLKRKVNLFQKQFWA